MRTQIIGSFIALLIGLFAAAAHAALEAQASVDRTVITQGDSFILTIRIDDTGGYDAPDYRVLEQDFQLFGSSQSSQHVINNGRIESFTQWQVTLVPKRSGQLTIPALTVAGTRTQPIAVQVNPPSARANAFDGSEPVFVEVQTDRDSVYVQQQLLLTARVFIALPLTDMQLTKPAFDNATVKQISETKFDTRVNGIAYEVHELVYAIFPQQPGELTIPELVFSGIEGRRPRSLFDFPGQGRALRKMSQQLQVRVKPVPPSFSGEVWLPASNLTLAESWNQDPNRLQAGESVTRSIIIQANGLPAAQLPALKPPTVAGAKFYADQPAIEDAQDAAGILGKRIEKAALIPTAPGRLQLPEIRVVWWDVDSDSEKTATLAGHTLQIEAGAGLPAAPAGEQPQPAAEHDAAAPLQPSAPQPIDAVLLGWQMATACLALLWAITLLLYLRLKRDRSAPPTAHDSTDKHGDERAAWQLLTEACRTNDAAAARRALLQWARAHFGDASLHTSEQLQRVADSSALSLALQQLDNHLFGTLPDSGEWNGEMLLEAAKTLRKRTVAHRSAEPQLAPLYPLN